ncbi:ABC transporter substrate-binding protein [Bdellovibrionota bacterium FG-1]
MKLGFSSSLAFLLCILLAQGCDQGRVSKDTQTVFDPRNPEGHRCLPPQITALMRTKASSLDPAKIIAYMDNQLALTAFGQLVALDEYENIRPYLAKRWEISKDGLEYTFEIDGHYRFSNGNPITAFDVIATFNRLFSPKLGSKVANYLFGDSIIGTSDYRRGKISSLVGLTSPEPGKVRFTLKQPRANFLSMLTMGPASILPSETPVRPLKESEIISSGPFVVSSFAETSVTLERNPHFPDFLNLTTIQYKYGGEDCCSALKSGAFDFIDAGPLDSAICDSPGYNLTRYAGANIWFISFGTKISSGLRRAISSCIYRDEYLKDQRDHHTTATALDGIFPAQQGKETRVQKSLPPPEKTCQLQSPARLKLLVSNRHHYTEKLLSLFTRIKNLSVDLIKVDDTAYHAVRESGDYDLLFVEFTGTFSDPTFYSALFGSKGSVVASGYANPAYDGLAGQLASAASYDARAATMVKIEELVKKDPPAIFIKQHDNIEWLRSSLKLNRDGWSDRYFFTMRTDDNQKNCTESGGR